MRVHVTADGAPIASVRLLLEPGESYSAGDGVLAFDAGKELSRGVVPDWSVVVSATRPRTFPGGEFGMPCALVIKRLTPGERHDKAALEDALRSSGTTT